MGTDFKTNGITGLKLYSIEEGYVSRINVSAYGYGKVVYIDHPNGITSVYAHCSSFKGQIDSIVRHYQKENKSFEVAIYPKKNEIKLEKGQVFALSGNSGSSTAPHLHFELRDTKTEAAINPLIFGFDIPDHKAPQIRNVKLYAITKEGYRVPGKSKVARVNFSNGNYYLTGNQILIPADFVPENCFLGLAFDVIDRLDGANNKCGLYSSYTILDQDTIFSQKIDNIPFESTRFVNIHKDYREYSANSRKFHKSFKTDQNDLPIYSEKYNYAFNSIHKKDTFKIDYNAIDAQNNTSKLSFKIIKANGEKSIFNWNSTGLLHPNSSKLFYNDSIRIEFAAGSVYEPINIDSTKIGSKIGKRSTPVHLPYKLIIKEDSSSLSSKKYVEIITNKSRSRRITGEYYNGELIYSMKYFGDYKVKTDLEAPSIGGQTLRTNATLSRGRTIKWRISDGETGISDYWLFINDTWVLLEYDYKTGYIVYKNTGGFTGQCNFKLIVEDNVGNQSIKKPLFS